jgi:hypothetical protein
MRRNRIQIATYALGRGFLCFSVGGVEMVVGRRRRGSRGLTVVGLAEDLVVALPVTCVRSKRQRIGPREFEVPAATMHGPVELSTTGRRRCLLRRIPCRPLFLFLYLYPRE